MKRIDEASSIEKRDRLHVAVDIGAGSGRVFAGFQKNGRLILDELYRFESAEVCVRDTHVRNIYRWQEEVINGLKCFVRKYGDHLESIGADSFGSDFVFIDAQGNICKMPQAYRYSKPSQQAREKLASFGSEKMYGICGNQSTRNDTLLQIIEEGVKPGSVLPHVRGILFFGDLFHFFLCGNACTELSLASYSKMMNQKTWQWEEEIFRYFGLDESIKMPVVHSGDKIGKVYSEICCEVGLTNQPDVVTPAIHDTADAAFAVPDTRPGTYFNSSGTWSLLGTVLDKPVLTQDAWKFNASNSSMPLDQYMFKKMITGMWLLQCCKSEWGRYSFAEISDLARNIDDNRYYIDPDEDRFFNPVCMSREISQSIHEKYGVRIDAEDVPRISRIILESLALKYRYTLDELGKLSGTPAERLYIVGGGCQNKILNQLTANACNITVYAGIPEATVAGNILCQMYGMGEIADADEAHTIISNSFELERYEPEEDNKLLWQKKYNDFVSK